MSVSKFTKALLFLLPILINCQDDVLEKECVSANCTRYKSDTTFCDNIGHLADPFNNECIARCDGPCVNGYCEYCFCHSSDDDAIYSAKPSECKRVFNGTHCTGSKCSYLPIQFCNINYIINPFDDFECVLRCDEDSCGNGSCTAAGYCICDFGYRHDIINPRVCLKIPQSDNKTCHKGFKLENGNCTSMCGDCQNGGCDINGVCRCWENFRMNVTTATCVEIDNTTFNMNVTENMVLITTHNTYITILICVITVLLFTTTVLVFIVIKMKRAKPLKQDKLYFVRRCDSS